MRTRKLSRWLLGGTLAAASVVLGAPATASEEPATVIPATVQSDRQEVGTTESEQPSTEVPTDEPVVAPEVWEWQ